MYIEYWEVGSRKPVPLPFDATTVAKHLLLDWVPSLPVQISNSFMGWPMHLLESVSFENYPAVCLVKSTGQTERQWKGFMSWMLGVAGTREVLDQEGYRWIAPLSAFYENAIQQVLLPNGFPLAFTPTELRAHKAPGSGSRLRPDYLAVRSTAATPLNAADWAVVESKGTKARLTRRHSPLKAWRRQVKNVDLKVEGASVVIPRRIVVATRVNPNAKRARTRRLQVRAWNARRRAATPDAIVLDVVTQHLVGFFRNLGLFATARTLGVPPWRTASELSRYDRGRDYGRADEELAGTADGIRIATEVGPIHVRLTRPLFDLTRALRDARDPRAAMESIATADRELDKLQAELNGESGRVSSVLPFGAEVRFPEAFHRARLGSEQ